MALAKIVKIDAVEDHPLPGSTHLSVMTIEALKGVSQKVSSPDLGSTDLVHRYAVGDLVLAIFEGAVVPEYLLRRGFWDEEKQRGMLPGGKQKNRMKATKFNTQESHFIMFPVIQQGGDCIIENDSETLVVAEGDDVAQFLGITTNA